MFVRHIATAVTKVLVTAYMGVALAACTDATGVPQLDKVTRTARVVDDSNSLPEIARRLAETKGIGNFKHFDDALLWRFIAEGSDSTAIVGIKSPGATTGVDNRGRWTVTQADWIAGQQAIRNIPGAQITVADTLMPWLGVHLRDLKAFQLVRSLPFTDYMEPSRLIGLQNNDSGCDEQSVDPYLDNDELLPSGDWLPWNYSNMRIDRAWAYAPGGRGVKVGLVDTGVDPTTQEFTISQFTAGESGARELTFGNDQTTPACSHGTRMAGIIAAGKNGHSVVGVAWASHFFTIRHGDAIIANETSIINGIRAAGNWGARVIEMAFGTVDTSNTVWNEIKFWHYGPSPDVAFVGAAGTWSWCWPTNSQWVLFPASVDEVLAVSYANHDGFRPCDAAYGDKVDVVAYHDQPTTGRAWQGWGDQNLVRVQGSSNASAEVAGVVALIRQRFPTMQSEFVYDRIRSTTGFRCGLPNVWNNDPRSLLLNAEAAVGGMCWDGVIHGPNTVIFERGGPDYIDVTYTISAPTGGVGPYELRWGSDIGASTTVRFTRGWYDTFVGGASARDMGVSLAAVLARPLYVSVSDCDSPPPNGQVECPY